MCASKLINTHTAYTTVNQYPNIQLEFNLVNIYLLQLLHQPFLRCQCSFKHDNVLRTDEDIILSVIMYLEQMKT